MIISTTGTQDPVIITGLRWTDNNDLSLSHPTTNFDLLEYYDQEELDNVQSVIQDLIDNGHITAQDEAGNPIVEADAVSPDAIRMRIINGQYIPCFYDAIREKWLSTSEGHFFYAESALSDNDWIQIGHANDTQSAHPCQIPLTITRLEWQCENPNNQNKSLRLYVDDTEVDNSVIMTGSGPQQGSKNDFNIDLNIGQSVRMRAGTQGGNALDTVVKVFYRYRAN